MTEAKESAGLFDVRGVYDLAGYGVIVTGAGGGIGRDTARLFAAAGASVLCADISAGADETVSIIAAAGGDAFALRTDVSRPAEVQAMVDAAIARFGRLDVLVNNAAIISTAVVDDLDEGELDRLISVNLKGVFFCCQAGARPMAARRSGSIVNVASSAIDLALPQAVGYSMCKAAVAQLTKCLAVELGSANIRVNTVAPGFVVTPMTSRHFTNADGSIDEGKKRSVVAELSRGQVLDHEVEAVDIAHTILFLASPAARLMTGQIVRPNGGVSMPW
jgi:3-oxoacyl-[acyl-carrier protein] reductase